MSRDARYMSQAEAKRAGWFSRRHETNEAHRAAGTLESCSVGCVRSYNARVGRPYI